MDAEAAAILRQEATAYDVLGVDPRADANAIRRGRYAVASGQCNHSQDGGYAAYQESPLDEVARA